MAAFVEMADRQMKELEVQKQQLEEAMSELEQLRNETAGGLS